MSTLHTMKNHNGVNSTEYKCNNNKKKKKKKRKRKKTNISIDDVPSP